MMEQINTVEQQILLRISSSSFADYDRKPDAGQDDIDHACRQMAR
jgi:hypothetical protein